MKQTHEREALLDDFADRSFFQIADGDYIAARAMYRAKLFPQFLSASQQAMEKYLKYVLVLNRIQATNVRHHLSKALAIIGNSKKVQLSFTDYTKEFLQRLDSMGRFRYGEVSSTVFDRELRMLDWAVWEVRRHCTRDPAPARVQIQHGVIPARIRIPGGYLEQILDDTAHPAREALLWHNLFFGRRKGKVRM